MLKYINRTMTVLIVSLGDCFSSVTFAICQIQRGSFQSREQCDHEAVQAGHGGLSRVAGRLLSPGQILW